MSKSGEDPGSVREYEDPPRGRDRTRSDVAEDAPAFGLVVETDHVDAALREVLRAREEGFPVLVACEDPDLCRFLDRYATETVERSDDPAADLDDRSPLVRAARTRDYAGLIVARARPGTLVDFARSRRTLQDQPDRFAVRAATKPVPTGRTTGPVLAAIPALNEAATIEAVVTATAQYVDEVLVVDDGSDDDTAARAREAGADVVEHGANRGYGAAVKTAFAAADRRDARHLVLLDGDGQHDPDSIPELLAVQRAEEAELVIGSRYVDGAASTAPTYRRAGLRVINRVVNASIRVLRGDLRVADTQSGFRAFDRRAIRLLADDDGIDDGMAASLDVLFRASAHGFTVEEVGTEVRYGSAESTHHPVKHGVGLLARVGRTLEGRRPVLTLGVPGGVMVLCGVLGVHAVLFGELTGPVDVALGVAATLLTLAGWFALTTLAKLHALSVFFTGRGPR